MMRRVLLLLSILTVMAGPAGAAIRFVAQSARGTGSGADSSNAQSIANFNTGAVAGDVALLLGNFSTAPTPSNSGTRAAPIVYRSLFGRPNDVCFLPAADFNTGAHSWYGDSNVVWRDITVQGGIGLGSPTQSGPWQVRNAIVLAGGVNLTNVRDCHLDSVYCTRNDGGPYMFQAVNYGDSTGACRRDTLRNSSFTLNGISANGGVAINIFSGYDMVYESSRFIVITGTASFAGDRFARVLGTNRGHMSDCYFLGVDNMVDGGTDEPMTFSLKDGVKVFKMYRDTVIIRGNVDAVQGTSPAINLAQNESDGYVQNTGEEIGGNSWRSCYFRNETVSGAPLRWGVGFDGDSLVGNTFVVNAASVQSSYSRGDPVMSTGSVVDHNVFVSFGNSSPAFSMQQGTAQQAVAFTNNVFYNPAMTNSDTTTARAFNLGYATDWATNGVGPVGDNYNLVWTPKVTTRRQVTWYSGAKVYSAFGMSPLLTLRVPASLDTFSRCGPSLIRDSTMASFDAHPLAGSAALFGPDGYVGPFVLAGSGDVIPPGQVTDLAATSPTQQAVVLAWSAPGNDGYVGSAAAYDVRWSTQMITAATFAAASVASGPPTPGVAGTPQSLTVSGLPSGTACYFALKARDAAGNWSSLSSVAMATPVGDTAPPAIVKDLQTNP